MMATDKIRTWREDPVRFVREVFGVEPDGWQADALRAFGDPDKPRISMQACTGPGKTTVLAWMAWHFLSCWAGPGEHPKGAAVSITADNLRDNLWPELAKWQQRSEFLKEAFVLQKQRLFAKDHPETWFLSARSWPKTASPAEQGRTLSGLHSEYVLAIIDESGAIPPTVLRAAEQALSRCKVGKIVQAGNPLTRSGMLYTASAEFPHLWEVIRVSGDPDDPKRSPRINLEWAREMVGHYGRDDPWVQAYILGQFPASAVNTLLDPDEVRAAMGRQYHEHDLAGAARILGVDVAREGLDLSVIFPRQGRQAYPPKVLRGVDSIQGAGEVARQWNTWDADGCMVDATGGFGAGWIDQLRALGYTPVAVEFSGRPRDPRYLNKRTEMHFELAQWVREGGALPDCPELIRELCEPVYFFKGDRVALEDKVQIKARIGRSPDHADALACTFAFPVAKVTPEEHHRRLAGGGQHETDHDPYRVLAEMR